MDEPLESDSRDERDEEEETDEVEGAYLENFPEGAGCVEIWERLSERRRDK